MQVIGHFHTREWPEEILSGILEQKILLPATPATAINCFNCEEQPLCDVRFREEKGINVPYFTCPQCGPTPLKAEEIRQFKVSQDGIATLLVKELGLGGNPIHKQEHFWDLGAYPQGEAGDRVFLLRETSSEYAEKVKTTLESEAGLCFGLGLEFGKPAWLPKRLCFFSLRREIRFDGKAFRMDAERVQNVHDRFLDDLKPELRDEFNNPRPAKLALIGNAAGRNRDLQAEWRKYLGDYAPEVQVYLFEKETAALDWKQAQRARFIFSGESAETQYNRHFKKLESTALSGNPLPEGGWFGNLYKQRRNKSVSE
jgi:hypothetical protein